MNRAEAFQRLSQIPVTEVRAGARELASLLAFAVRLNDRQAVEIALTIQNYVNNGMLKGEIVTRDYREGGEIVFVWEKL